MLDKLPADVRQELSEYPGRKHHSRGTYAIGCHGPLCRKAERDRGRKRTETKALSNGKPYSPNLDIRLEEDILLDEIVEWYESLRRAS